MPLSKCPRCQQMFNKRNVPICPKCEPAEDADYEIVRRTLEEQPNLTPQQLTEITGVVLTCIMRLLDEGRIASMPDQKTKVVCGRCGAPAISLSKRLCESCLQKLNSEVAKAQASIKLAKKKKVEIGTAMNIRKWQEND